MLEAKHADACGVLSAIMMHHVARHHVARHHVAGIMWHHDGRQRHDAT